jgi:hypothetical protein
MNPYLTVCIQRHKRDCAVACLSMLLGKPYEIVLLAFRHNVIEEGASIKQMQGAVRRLGHKLLWQQRLIDYAEDTGVVVISSPRWGKYDHLVVVKEGLIVDTDATIWEPDVFMSAYEARPSSILVIDTKL